MKISRNTVFWGLGITATVITIGVVIRHHRKKIKSAVKDVADKVHNWLKPVSGKITSKFGYRTDPKTGAPHAFHNGIDLALAEGTKIKNPLDGYVQDVNFNPKGGNQVIIMHENGYSTGYSHLSQALVKKGDKVKQGDVIALSGNTGKSTGPHLHFTLNDPSGAKVDPMKYIYV